MSPQIQSFTTNLPPSLLPTTHFPKSCNKPIFKLQFNPFSAGVIFTSKSYGKNLFRPLRCSVSVASEPTHLQFNSDNNNDKKPRPAEVSRTIMELSSVGTLSTLTSETWPLGIGVRFAVDSEGTPVVCLNASYKQLSSDKRSSLNVQLEQCGSRTLQCTIQGCLERPDDRMVLKKLQSVWEKKFGEEVDSNRIYVLSVEEVLHIEDFMEDGFWVSSIDYRQASPDPLRDFAEQIVHEINTHNMEDVFRFYNIFVDSDIQISEAKMVWVDRLGFDMRIRSSQECEFEVRIPFPREVTDEKGAKSSFNCMSQLAWEVERNYQLPEFEKVKVLKKIPFKDSD